MALPVTKGFGGYALDASAAGSSPGASGLTATPSGTQANSLLLTSAVSRFTTVASSGDGALLPPSTPGISVIVINSAAANPMNIFPQPGDQINLLGLNQPLSLAAAKVIAFFCSVAGQWNTILTA